MTSRLILSYFHSTRPNFSKVTQRWLPYATASHFKFTDSVRRFSFTALGSALATRPPLRFESSSITRAMSSTDTPSGTFRLPSDVKPTHYDLTIKTDLEQLTFQGLVKIDLDVKTETSKLVINVADLEIESASVYAESQKQGHDLSSPVLDATSERATFELKNALPAGSKAQVRITFKGKLTGSMMGYYRSSWDDNGKRRSYTLTQFEPTAARRAFPCFDEPLLKATFTIAMISRADTVNLSNMPVVHETEYQAGAPGNEPSLEKLLSSMSVEDKNSVEKWKITKFETTPLMSTYLVAYANGHFKYLESSYKSPLSGKTRPLRIYATANHIHQGQFALDVKAKVLPIYEKLFDIEYPLPKLDTLVVEDFDAGAMENWGLITGRTSIYLLDPNKADTNAKKRCASTQAHEVAHMWFGNITTMEWWNYLYLNEGFASLMGEVIIMEKAYPEWRPDSSFITDHLNRALTLDAKLSSHPIEVDCPNANDIGQIFDALSYSKAASVLRMLCDYVGEEKFLKGVSIYLKKRQYGNSVTADLWEGIAAATGVDVGKIMENWITMMGFPILTVKETDGGIVIRQDRYLETGPAEPKDNETIWTVPLNIVSVDKAGKAVVDKAAILSERERFFPLDTSKPFAVNYGAKSVCHVLYSPERLSKIAAEAVKEQSIFSLNDRISLVHDIVALSKSGHSPISNALTLIDILRNEKEYLVWNSMASSLATVVGVWWENAHITDLLRSFRRGLYKPLVERLGYEADPKDSVAVCLLRAQAIKQALSAKDEGVIKELTGRFAHYLKTGDDSMIPGDIESAIYKAAVKYGGRAEFDFMKKVYEKPKTQTANLAAMFAMGATEDPVLMQETFEFILSKARDQDSHYFFAGLGANPKARRPLAIFFKNNFELFAERFKGSFAINYLIKFALGDLSTEKDYQDTVEFFKDKDTSKYNKALSQTLDTIRSNAAWIDRSTPNLLEWLEKLQSRVA